MLSGSDEQARQILTLEARLAEAERELQAVRTLVCDRLAAVIVKVDGMADRMDRAAANAEAAAAQVKALAAGERDRIRHVVNSDLRNGTGIGYQLGRGRHVVAERHKGEGRV